MTKRKLYKVLASAIGAYKNCLKAGNTQWESKWMDFIEYLEKEYLPSGSGIDSGTSIDIDKSHSDALYFNSSYHTMDEYGYYGRWINFTVIMKPSLAFDTHFSIKGNFGKDRDLGDMLIEQFDHILNQEVNEYPE